MSTVKVLPTEGQDMTSIRTTFTLSREAWHTLASLHEEPVREVRLPRVAFDIVHEALSVERTSRIPAHRLHSVRVERMITSAQARRIMEWADTIHDEGYTFSWDERESVRTFADTVAIAHGMPLTTTY